MGGGGGQEKVVVGKWRQLYLNINKKWLKRKNKIRKAEFMKEGNTIVLKQNLATGPYSTSSTLLRKTIKTRKRNFPEQ